MLENTLKNILNWTVKAIKIKSVIEWKIMAPEQSNNENELISAVMKKENDS